ncbi:MAG: zinc-ribbon domain-containing protein [Chloroflexi bacterium]|nr:zinc-ribbon domain-containing protein [Chloroflexota bacterium]
MITCRVCGSQNKDEAAFCGMCGERLEPPARCPPGHPRRS